ncbi:MAG: DUF2484 family protein [Pseudomonadota bacterium]
MPLSLTLACLWAIVACAVAFLPSKRSHWPQAVVLIAIGIPLLGFVTYENGPLVGLLCFGAGASILRWPVVYAVRWLRASGRRAPAKRATTDEREEEKPASSTE